MNDNASMSAVYNSAKGTALRSSGTCQQIDLRVGGITCPHCPPTIEKAVGSIAGVTSAHVNLVNKLARIVYDPSRAKVTDILRAIRSVGYRVGTATARTPIKGIRLIRSSCGAGGRFG